MGLGGCFQPCGTFKLLRGCWAQVFVCARVWGETLTCIIAGTSKKNTLSIFSGQNQGSGWLDDLQIHGWDSDAGTAIFLKPWSKGNFSDEEVAEMEELFRVYRPSRPLAGQYCTDGSPPGSPIPGILQDRTLEWVAISFSRGSF